MKFCTQFITLLCCALSITTSHAQVSDGQSVNASVTNGAFLYKNSDTTALGKVNVNNSSDPTVSGSEVFNIQRELNSISSFTGKATNEPYNYTPSWSNNDVGASTDSLKLRDEALTGKFNGSSGHAHTGADGDGARIAFTSLTGLLSWTQINQVDSVNGAASTPTLLFNGTPYSGGTSTTTTPMILIQPSGVSSSNNWNTGGTYIGINDNSNANNFLDFQSNATDWFKVDAGGNVTSRGGNFTLGNNSAGRSAVLNLNGGTSGTVTLEAQAAAGTYSLFLPTSAGSNGQCLLSGGNGGNMSFGTLGVAAGGTGITIGTSGGVPYFSSSSAISSSGALTQYGVMLGGGAGNAPFTLPTPWPSGEPLVAQGNSSQPSWTNQLAAPVGINMAASCHGLCIQNNGNNADGNINLVNSTGTKTANIYIDTSGFVYIVNSSASTYALVSTNAGNAIIGGSASAVSGSSVTVRQATNQVQLSVVGNSTQTSNLQNWDNNSGTPLAFVASDGSITAPTVAATTTPIGVTSGGTGIASATAYAPIAGGTTSTGAWQSLGSGISNSGYVLTSNGSSAAPTWQAAVSGGANPVWNYTGQSSNYNASVNDYIGANGTFTITLPTAVGSSGKTIAVEHVGANIGNTVTIDTTSAQSVCNKSSGGWALQTYGEYVIFQSDGSNWNCMTHLTDNGIQTGNTVSITATSQYTFTGLPSSSITAGTIYTNNGQTFTVSSTTASSTSLACSGTGAPSASGTLTFVSGSPSGNLTFTGVTTSSPAFGTATTNALSWSRQGMYATLFYDLNVAGSAAGSGNYVVFLPSNMSVNTSIITSKVTTAPQTTAAAYLSLVPVNGGIVSGGSSLTSAVEAFFYNSNSFQVWVAEAGTASTGMWGSSFFQFSSAINARLVLTVPISGWQP